MAVTPRGSGTHATDRAGLAATTDTRTVAPALGGPPPLSRVVSGRARSGRRTKLLVAHLRRGEIAILDHRDLDRVSAEELIEADVVAVLNCRPSSSGTYPNLGPQLLTDA